MYRQVSVNWFFNWTQMNKDDVVGVIGVEGAYLTLAMSTLVEKAMNEFHDWDRFVVMEQDMIPPVDALQRIAQYGPEHDIVGSTYFKHEPPHHVMAWQQVKPPHYSPLSRDVVRTMVENPALYEVDGVAMGLTSISREVFEGWDPSVPMWHPTPPLAGHDLHFCNEAKKQGFKVWLDSGIGCGHLTEMPIGYAHSQEALALHEPPTWQQAYDEGIVPDAAELAVQ
jgi:hypothetical protein